MQTMFCIFKMEKYIMKNSVAFGSVCQQFKKLDTVELEHTGDVW